MKKTDAKSSKRGSLRRKIDPLRQRIDRIDEQILDLINERLFTAQEIGKIKLDDGTQVVDGSRESKLLNRLKKINKGPLSRQALQHIYTEIIAASREIQGPQRVAFLGPEATFTHIAAVNHFGRSLAYAPLPSIRDIFSEVEKGVYHYGVVPVENSIEGAVNYTLDLFFESDLHICAEIYHAISHDLLSRTADLKEIRAIYSHPQAFAQCRHWLRKNMPDTILIDCSSTAEAAKKAGAEADAAAIASREAADNYQLEVVAGHIEDTSRNVTRFLVIGKDQVKPTGQDKTSLMFVTAHVPGALFNVLKPIAEANINMLKLESRPTKHENWSYFFFVDLAGHITDQVVSRTVEKMKKLCFFLKLLGAYPRTDDQTFQR